ncbi:hypothetical protein K505DRAFT_12375 [Melanomma pulvis-pyrius CBS 109.77]|uniref:Uncharacterized protein n=1 Tax=Melanomma pulvis-pyrius CBS 109.77 TaxID=1314802 RepID=A0A6A6XV85_9PLEO|nr:hypothetical protein K505DRAFT_12375 [Melanomma pulvis-pyrius CBS 109.77]
MAMAAAKQSFAPGVVSAPRPQSNDGARLGDSPLHALAGRTGSGHGVGQGDARCATAPPLILPLAVFERHPGASILRAGHFCPGADYSALVRCPAARESDALWAFVRRATTGAAPAGQ